MFQLLQTAEFGSFGHVILQEHMETCVVEEVKNGNRQIMQETMELVKKLK